MTAQLFAGAGRAPHSPESFCRGFRIILFINGNKGTLAVDHSEDRCARESYREPLACPLLSLEKRDPNLIVSRAPRGSMDQTVSPEISVEGYAGL